MSNKSIIMMDINDPKIEKIADVISNKTSKKIIELLVDGELSSSEISSKLKIPINTVCYNIKNLEGVGLIEKVKGILWSVKGKRIYKYKLSNKKIIISPKKIVRGVIPTVLISGIIAFGIKIFAHNNISFNNSLSGQDNFVLEKSTEIVQKTQESALKQVSEKGVNFISNNVYSNAWLWFLLGTLVGLFIYLCWNNLEKLRRGN